MKICFGKKQETKKKQNTVNDWFSGKSVRGLFSARTVVYTKTDVAYTYTKKEKTVIIRLIHLHYIVTVF